MPSLPDQDWLDLRAGDHGALERLYRAHGLPLLRYGRGLAQDSVVTDALHDLFVRIWERRAALPAEAHPRAYLLTALRHDLFRTVKRLARTEEFAHEKGDDDHVEFRWIAAEGAAAQSAQLQAALTTLSDRERELVTLRYFDDLDYARISEVTGISYQSARNVLTRAISKLRGRMSTIIFVALGTGAVFSTLLIS